MTDSERIVCGENWKPVVGYEGVYSVSDHGNVRRDRRAHHNLRPGTNSYGYKTVSLCVNGKMRSFLVHRLVALAFLGHAENGIQCNHKNGVVDDNRLENLEWVTSSENCLHSYRVLGNKVHEGNVSRDVVREMQTMRESGKRHFEIAESLGVSATSVQWHLGKMEVPLISDETVNRIRAMLNAGKTLMEIKRETGVSKGTVYNIRHNLYRYRLIQSPTELVRE